MLTLRVLPRRGVLLRSALATLEIMTVVVAAHTWAGGSLPPAAWVAGAAALVFAAGTVVLRGRASLRAVVPALVVAQFLLHCWMAVLAPASSSGHAHAHHLELTWPMVLAHLAGGLVSAAVWLLRRRAVEIVLAWSDPGLLPLPMLRRVLTRQAPVPPLRRPLVVVPLRGPPVGLAT